jgi:hypothetical protein
VVILEPIQEPLALQLSGFPPVDQDKVVEFVGKVIELGLAERETVIGITAHILPFQAEPEIQLDVTVD